ncbi:hypothetical protein ACWDA7_42190 [Streptomyces sp. NPDC001156]
MPLDEVRFGHVQLILTHEPGEFQEHRQVVQRIRHTHGLVIDGYAAAATSAGRRHDHATLHHELSFSQSKPDRILRRDLRQAGFHLADGADDHHPACG